MVVIYQEAINFSSSAWKGQASELVNAIDGYITSSCETNRGVLKTQVPVLVLCAESWQEKTTAKKMIADINQRNVS